MSRDFQVIDGALNSTFDVFQVPDDTFALLFPEGTDVAFADEVNERLGVADDWGFWEQVYRNKVNKKKVIGIHGTLHLTGSPCSKEFFPDRKESNVIN